MRLRRKTRKGGVGMRLSQKVTLVSFHRGEQLSPHFKGAEFVCPCCGTGIIAMELIYALEKMRADLGMPIIVTSGYRCPKHNAEIGGARDSYHMMGLAADITVREMEIKTIARLLVKIAMQVGFTGVILYPKHVHVDLRFHPYFRINSEGGDRDDEGEM